jgi:GH24 family phage-related lysozyme (muramidase)
MKTGARGLSLIRQFEGLRLDAYQDSVGIWTIGYGHTHQAGPPKPMPGLRITRPEADALLVRDLTSHEAVVQDALRREASQDQFDAMVSLCFNIGPGNFARSSLIRAFNDGDEKAAAEAFLAWTRAGSKVLPGLIRRREAEKRLFLSRGRTTSAKWAVAGAGGTVGGTIAAGAAQSFASSLGFGLSSVLDWRGLLVIGLLAGITAIGLLWTAGEERRERLWDRLFA